MGGGRPQRRGALLHVAALNYGPLTLVQPLGALTLVAAVPLGARAAGRRVGRTEWRGTVLTLLGLGALLLTTGGGSAPQDTLTLPEALGVGAATMAVVAGLSRPGARPGLRHAAASGITSGVASALTQTLTVAVTDRSGGPLFNWRLLTVALLVSAFAMGGLVLSQTAYRGGLGATLAVVTLANPVAAAAIGLALLGERLQGGPVSLILALFGTAAAGRGVILLSRAQARGADRGGGRGPRAAGPGRLQGRDRQPPARRRYAAGRERPRSRRGAAGCGPLHRGRGTLPRTGDCPAPPVTGNRPAPTLRPGAHP